MEQSNMNSDNIMTPFNLWISSWIDLNPPAKDIAEAKNYYTTAELMSKCYMETLDATITQENITRAMVEHEYVYYNGSWLTM
jgi:hypothetical protein